jgi:hypothetical protein
MEIVLARIRTIKPEFPQSESMGRVSRSARLCFILLWTIADDEGRLRGSSRMLASLLFPYDDDAPTLMDGWIEELEREGCVNRYQSEGSTYIEIAKWLSHQKIDKPSKSKIAPFSEDSRIVAKAREVSCEDQGSRIKEGIKDQGEEESANALVAVAPKQKPAKDVLGVDFLIAQGCEESHARDWMKARRAKKAPLTETAWDGLCREARKAGLSPSEAVRMCAARSWASLKAEWLTKDQGQQETTYQRTMREKYEKWVPSLAAKAPAAKRDVFEVIDEIRPTTPPALG